MPRPRKIRLIQAQAPAQYYKPRGIPLGDLRETVLSLDGLEALRLADMDGREQVDAAAQMGISRSTFSRLLAEAHRAVATALANGWAIRIGGGPVAMAGACAGRSRRCVRRKPRAGDDEAGT